MVVSSVTTLQNLRVEAAVDIQRRSSDIGSRRACQKRNGRSHLLGFAVTAERRRRFLQAGKITVTRRVHVGINGTRLDIIYGDALGTQITSPAAGIGSDGAFCGRIVGSAWPRRGVARAWARTPLAKRSLTTALALSAEAE